MAKRKTRPDDLFRTTPNHPNKKLKLSIPLPPSINHMYVHSKGGKKFLTNFAQEYVLKARALINLAIDEQSWSKQDREVWQYIDLVFYMPDRRIRDSHNMLKLLLDVMQSVAFENDYFVMPRIQSVELDEEFPRVDLALSAQTEKCRQRAIQMTKIS